MRRTAPLIVGAGPAGCAAAIVLGGRGVAPVMIDRDEEVGDPLCGGFLSWRTARNLGALGIDVAALGAARVERLALFARSRSATLALPRTAYGLSRHALDTAMRRRAAALGADLQIDTIRSVKGTTALGRDQEWTGDGLFLASGKHDIRGTIRPREEDDPALGLRIRLPQTPPAARGAIELHLFEGGYAGVVEQEGGSLNICLAVRKSMLGDAENDPHRLLSLLADRHPAFAARFCAGWEAEPVDSIGSVPYGFIARETEQGLFRLGDQAAVIPSLAGEGNSIAIASGIAAAQAWLEGGASAAQGYQADFARKATRPVALAGMARSLAERPAGSAFAIAAARAVPPLATLAMRATRIDIAPRSLALPPASV